MLAPLNASSPRFRSNWLVAISLLGSALMAGCAGRNIHSELKEDPQILHRKWTLPTVNVVPEAGERNTEHSNPVVVENTLVFGTQNLGLVSMYPGINQVRWVLPIQNGVLSELSVDQSQVYFGGGDGFLYCVNLENGRVLWRYDVRNPMISRPTVSAGKVFVTTSDDTIYAFDAATGKWLWHYRRRSSQAASILGASAPLVDGNEVMAGLSDGFLVALAVQDGQLKWERKLHQGTKFTDVDADPLLENGVIYLPSYDGALYALSRQGGAVQWRFDAGASRTVSLEANRIFLPSSDGNVYALQRENAKVLWKFELDSGSPTRLLITEKYVIVGSSFQYLYVLDKETGKGLYRFNVGHGSGFSGSPAYDASTQRIYFLSAGGNLHAFSITPPPRKNRPAATSPYVFFKP